MTYKIYNNSDFLDLFVFTDCVNLYLFLLKRNFQILLQHGLNYFINIFHRVFIFSQVDNEVGFIK